MSLFIYSLNGGILVLVIIIHIFAFSSSILYLFYHNRRSTNMIVNNVLHLSSNVDMMDDFSVV